MNDNQIDRELLNELYGNKPHMLLVASIKYGDGKQYKKTRKVVSALTKAASDEYSFFNVISPTEAGNPRQMKRDDYRQRLTDLIKAVDCVYICKNYTFSKTSLMMYEEAQKQNKTIIFQTNSRDRRRLKRAEEKRTQEIT